MPSLADRFCPNVHDAPITAAAYDPWSGVLATADAAGVVAVKRAGEAAPGLIFQPGGAITGALGLIRGGSLVAVGDDEGTIAVYRTEDGRPAFQEVREGSRGRVRAMRGVALSPDGARVASIAVDGLLRIWDIPRNKRDVAWQGFGGLSVAFDQSGTRILCMDEDGQPRMVDLSSHQALPMDKVQMPAERAVFSLDGTLVITVGASGIALLRVVDGQLVNSFAARGGSGILGLVQKPDGTQIGAVSQRSVHVFSMPDLQPVESLRHGAPEPSGAAWWGPDGIRVGGKDGLVHGGEGSSHGPVLVVGGFGGTRIAGHASAATVWVGDRRTRELGVPGTLREVHVDRDGRNVVLVPERGTFQVVDARSGAVVFDGAPRTDGGEVAIGGSVVAERAPGGGLRWWDFANNRAFELGWPIGMALSHGGTYLALVTPRGAIKILEPSTAREAMPDPRPSADQPARLLSFVNRRPDLLVIDAENVLSTFDLAQSAKDRRPAVGRDVIEFGAEPDHVWGITGGQYAAVRIPLGQESSIFFVDLGTQKLVSEVSHLHPRAWVDAENGYILEPARSGAILERDLHGNERRVLRSLPDGHWVCFSSRGILDASEGAGDVLGG